MATTLNTTMYAARMPIVADRHHLSAVRSLCRSPINHMSQLTDSASNGCWRTTTQAFILTIRVVHAP
jgi:hypothetical protein